MIFKIVSTLCFSLYGPNIYTEATIRSEQSKFAFPADSLLQLPFGIMYIERVLWHTKKKTRKFFSAAAEVTRPPNVVILEVQTSKGWGAQLDWMITDCQDKFRQ